MTYLPGLKQSDYDLPVELVSELEDMSVHSKQHHSYGKAVTIMFHR